MIVIIQNFKFKNSMPAKQKRDKKYEFLLEIEFTGESETNAHTFTALKDALNEKDDKNTVKELIAMKSKNLQYENSE